VLAQAALETQWGQHMPKQADGTSSYNLFGMKAGSSWDGDRVNVPTLEVEGGVPVRRRAAFRAYESPADSFDDYARLLGDNPRYAQALGKGDDVAGFAHGLVQGGYATDPAYARKIAAIADSPAMRQALSALKNAADVPTD
jgi:flagellar protein FlgJ